MATKTRALLTYGELLSRHGLQVHRRWIQGKPVADEAILDAPELGAVADVAEVYNAAARMRVLPIGWRTLTALLVPIAIPVMAVFSLQWPLKKMLLEVLKVVF